MTSTMPEDSSTPPNTAELDSEGSSGEERDTKKRLIGDLDTSGPKKRRKQTTPVRFPTTLINSEEFMEEEEAPADEDCEGKLRSSSQSSIQNHPKDENLNNEFRCQYCEQFFDSKGTLDAHLDSEHGTTNQSPVIKEEPPQQPDDSESPVNNLLSVKDFSTTWLSGHMQSQMQPDDWPSSSIPNHHLQTLPGFPGALAQFLPMPNFPMSDSGQLPRPPLGSAPIRIFNPDAYCDLCNKEFCNKYFLKTHKANKHGIYVDSPSPSVSDPSVPGSVSLYSGGSTFPSGNVNLEPPLAPPTPSIPCDICQKRFRNEDSLKKHKQKSHVDSGEQSEHQSTTDDERELSQNGPSPMESFFKQEYGVEQEDANYMPAPRHLSPQSVQQARDSGFNADRLRQLGVLNPEAFCEICCKEYCNKYFLRTHKIKRHGIYVAPSENEKSPSTPGSAASWHQVQTSPLNLIVAESTASSESGDRSAEDYECKSCGIRFQTLGLYQAHQRNVHEIEDREGSPKQDFDNENSEQPFSEDLQKLQTMILQLNGLEANKGSCAICGKEFESRAALHTHMSTEHGAASSGETSSPVQEKNPVPTSSSAYCTICEKDFPNQDVLRKHIADEHQPIRNPLNLPQIPQIPSIPSTPTSSSQERKIASMTPTSSYCEICNKELCNKYFMKTHMQRMHGIEIENGAQIGGVICNICNKELCSKYFLRVHKHNTHGIVDENPAAGPCRQEGYDSNPNSESNNDSALRPEQLGDLSHRYFTHFTEVCPICNRRFRSSKWLKAHLMGDHGKIGLDKWREIEQQYHANRSNNGGSRSSVAPRSAQQSPNLKIPNGMEASNQIKTEYSGFGNQVLSTLFGSPTEDSQTKNYRCSYCNFTTTVLPFLFLHERSHTSPQDNANIENLEKSIQCPLCPEVCRHPESLHQHLVSRHQLPSFVQNLQSPLLSNLRSDPEKSNESKDRMDCDRDERRQNSPHGSLNIQGTPEPPIRSQDNVVQVTPQGAYKCSQCGFATANLNRIKKHVKKDHKSIGDPIDVVITELSKTLKDIANKNKLPASFAMPQDMNSNPEKTIMQPFLLEEHEVTQIGEESSSERRFVPALVYLPVKTRISSSLTTSFTLTPA